MGHAGHGHDDDLQRLYGRRRARERHGLLMERPRTFWGRVKQFLWGMVFFELYHDVVHQRERYNDVMNLLLFGELLGIPLMNSSVGLRLLPYVLPELGPWKHRQLEEFDLVEHGPHIH